MAKIKPARNLYQKVSAIAPELILLAILLLPAIPANPAAAASDLARWSRANIPTEGDAGNWVLADGSDVRHLTAAIDGTLYAYGKSLTYTLYKSTDGGDRWSHIGNVQDNIVDITTAPDDANSIYYTTTSDVYRSTDGGETFHQLPANPGGAGSNNIEITSIAVARLNSNIIAVGTRDTDNAQFGGVYTLDEKEVIPSWTDTNLGSYDAYAVVFSPNFPADRQLVAVVTDETDTLVTTKIGGAGWGTTVGNARLDKDNSGTPSPVAVATSAAIAFPRDYDSDGTSEQYVQFIAIDTGSNNGDVYKINGTEAPDNSVATDLNIGSAYGVSNIDVTGLAVDGDSTSANLLTGAANNAQTYFSTDGGISWTRSRKEPTGGSKTHVLMVNDFSSSGIAYTATSGTESALSISQDNGTTWNQVSLIDTDISTILDLAPSPDYSQDNTLFMLTFGDSKHSLWRSPDGSTTWERIFTSALANVDTIELVELSPQYGTDSQVVFIAGSSNSRPSIWQSTDNGRKFTCRPALDPTTGAQITIDTWAVVNDTTLFICSSDGSNGLVYRTTNSGFFYSTRALAGSQSLHSIVLSPSYEQDETLVVGNTNGWVYWSNDNGISFKQLPSDITSSPLTGSVTVAFDPDFSSNNIVYAASNTADKGVYRFTIGARTDWESIDSTLPSGSTINQLVLLADGTLYAANSKADEGMERSLNPAFSLGPTFETVTRGLSDGATLWGTWQYGHTLWSVDTTNTRLMTFTDSLTSPLILTSPANTASGAGTLINHAISNISLDWATLRGATSYQWQFDYDTDLSTVPSGFEGNTTASSVQLPTLSPATTYYWRVRATAPISSQWSSKWSFTTSLDTEAIAFKLESPEAGESGVSIKPIFQWGAVAGAEAYELLISTNADFTNPAITKTGEYTLPTSAWQCNLSLDYDTTYYWKVKAVSTVTSSAWSTVGAFTTESPPAPPAEYSPATPPPSLTPMPPAPPRATSSLGPLPDASLVPPPMLTPPPPSPPAPPQPQPLPTPDWTVYLIGALLLVIILLIITMLLMVGLRRS